MSGWDGGDKEELFVYGSFGNAGNIMCQVTVAHYYVTN